MFLNGRFTLWGNFEFWILNCKNHQYAWKKNIKPYSLLHYYLVFKSNDSAVIIFNYNFSCVVYGKSWYLVIEIGLLNHFLLVRLLSNIVTVAYKLLFLQNVGLCFLFTLQWFYILLCLSFCASYNLNLSIFVLANVLVINISKWNCNKICFRKLENQLIIEIIVFSRSLSQS